jgi:phage terminase Nu1 subunit (DNA packaging protein)
MIVNKRQLSDILGNTEETLTQWQKQGMPILLSRRGAAGNQYETKDVLAWIDAQRQSDEPVTDYNTERTRKVKIEADILALDKAQKQGKLIDADTVEESWIRMVCAFKAKILAIPTKCAPAVVAASTFIEVEELLKTAIYDALSELSTENIEYSDPADPVIRSEDGEAAAEDDGEPMGQQPAKAKRGRQRGTGTI